MSSASATVTAEQMRTLAYLAGGSDAVLQSIKRVLARQRGSLELHERAMRSVSALPTQLPYASPLFPVAMRAARGAQVVDVDGNAYIDCHMAYTAALLGHAPPRVTAAVHAALDGGIGAGHLVEEQVRLAEHVKAMVPGLERVAFLHSGADAVAAAIRLARAATGRTVVAKFEGCYHGWCDTGLYNPIPVLAGRLTFGPPERIRPRAATAGVSAAAGAELLVLPFNSALALLRIREHADELACVVADPCPPFMTGWEEEARTFVRNLRAVTEEVGVPLVLDEVVSGFRLARGGAQEAFGVNADLVAYGKIASGAGIPLSIVGGSARLLDVARTDGVFADYPARKAWTSTTLAAGLPAVAAALAQLELLDDEYDDIMRGLDARHAALCERVGAIGREFGLALAVAGHPRLQSHLVLGEARAPAPDYRSAYAAGRLANLRAHMLMTLYLRAHGIYTKTVPTMNLSAAHSGADVEQIAEAIRSSLLMLREQGVVDGA